jgi:hypothetical protein
MALRLPAELAGKHMCSTFQHASEAQGQQSFGL